MQLARKEEIESGLQLHIFFRFAFCEVVKPDPQDI